MIGFFHNGTDMYNAENSTKIEWDKNRNYTFNASAGQNVYWSVFAK